MGSAEETAKELTRLKEVGKWKMEAGDITDDFGTKHTPPAAVAGAQKVIGKVRSASEKVVGEETSQGTMESIGSEASQKASDVASSASSAVIGTEPGMAEKATSKAAEAASAASKKASQAVAGKTQPKSESIVSVAKDKADQLAFDASGAIIGTPPPAYESVASQASDVAASAASALSEAVRGSSTPVTENIASAASTASSGASSAASTASRKVYGGAMAQKVGEQQKPILDDVFSDDDDSTYSEKMQSMVNQAGEKYAGT